MKKSASAPTKAQNWDGRLTYRRFTEPARPNSSSEYFARIDQGNQWSYFPLGSKIREIATTKANEIHQTVKREGWQSTCNQYSREITVALFWLPDPLASTYTTLFTQVEADQSHLATKKINCRKVLIVEPEQEVMRALVSCINQMPNYRCVGAIPKFGENDALGIAESPDLILFNHYPFDRSDWESGIKLRNNLSRTGFFPYGIYRNSDELFVTITNVEKGYFLRRRTPLHLLEPLGGTQRSPEITATWAALNNSTIISYFKKLVDCSSCSPSVELAEPLSKREQEILNCMLSGTTNNKGISASLGILEGTVGDHLRSIFHKLDVHSRTDAVLKYQRVSQK